jgi:hypothetical protein
VQFIIDCSLRRGAFVLSGSSATNAPTADTQQQHATTEGDDRSSIGLEAHIAHGKL